MGQKAVKTYRKRIERIHGEGDLRRIGKFRRRKRPRRIGKFMPLRLLGGPHGREAEG